MSLDWNAVLLVVGALLVLVEVLLGGFAGFDLVLVGTSLAIGGGLGMMFRSPTLGLVLASTLSILYIAGGRRWVRRRMRHRPVASNVDALIGARARVTQRIESQLPGQVRVNDEIWRASAAEGAGPFEPGTVVTVDAVDGVTLKVR